MELGDLAYGIPQLELNEGERSVKFIMSEYLPFPQMRRKRSSLWGVAFVIMGGCSDDGFDYFRGWLISRGEEVFNKVLKNPEVLAEYLSEDYLQEDEFAPQLEEILSVASDAYTYQKTGKFEYNDDTYTEFLNELEARGYKFEPMDIEFEWEEEDLEDRYPLLWERFGENPLT